MITETAALDPSEFIDGRVELALDQLGLAIDVDGVDWGEADIAVQLARESIGASVTDRHLEPVEMTIPLMVKEEKAGGEEISLAEAANMLEQKIGLLQREGGWIRRDFDDDAGFAGAVGYQVLKASISGLQGWLFADQQIADGVTLKILRSPLCYSTKEVESEVFTESVQRELVFELAEVLGTMPGLIRVRVTNEGTEHWRACTVALESRDHPQDATANTTAKMAYAAAALTPKGGAEITGGIAPEIRGVGTIASGTASISPGLPSGTQSGDLLIMIAESGGATEKTEANTALTAAGWSSPPPPYAGQKKGNTRLTVLYKIAKGNDATATNDTGDHQMARIVGVKAGTFDPETPFNTAAVSTQSLTKAVSIPGGTTTRDRCLILAAASGNLPDATTTAEFSAVANASLAGLTEQIDNTVVAGDGGALFVASGVKEAKGAYSATTATAVTEAERGVISLAINPLLVVRHKELTNGFVSMLNSKIAGVGHMTHEGNRLPTLLTYTPGGEPEDVQFRLRYRSLGSLRWEENKIVPVPLAGGWYELDLQEAVISSPLVGGKRWEWEAQARAVSGSGAVDLLRARIYPTEQRASVSSPFVIPAADSQSVLAPGTLANDSGTGAVAWTGASNAKLSDNSYAVVILKEASFISNYLKATNFGFAIPSTATICGVGVKAEVHASKDKAIVGVFQLTKDGTVLVGSSKTSGFSPTADGVINLGASDDLWLGEGLTGLTPADVNASTFGVKLVAFNELHPTSVEAFVDQLQVIVYYSEAASDQFVCFSQRSIEFATDGVCRQHPTDEVWGQLVPMGVNLNAPPSGSEKRIMRGMIVPSQGDLEEVADTGTNSPKVQVFHRPAFLFARDAA